MEEMHLAPRFSVAEGRDQRVHHRPCRIRVAPVQSFDYLNQRVIREIIGVVRDIRQDQPTRPVRPEIFVHWPQLPWLGASLVIRVKRDPFAVRNAVQRAIWSVDKTLPESNARTVDQILGEQVSEPRLYTILLGVFAVIALFLAVIGIYGLLNTIVNRHIHEMAIRVAIGAQSVDLIRLIVGQGLRISAVGLLIGLMATIGVTRVMKSLLFGVSPTDPLTLGAVALLLLIVGLLACYIPTRRAMTVDPMVALRCE